MPTGVALRVGVDVTPRLFSDALIRVLEHHDVEVVSILSVGTEGLDVVVTSPGGRDRIPSDVVVVEVRPGAASSAVEEPTAVAPSDTVHDLDDLIAVIRRFAGPGQDVSTE